MAKMVRLKVCYCIALLFFCSPSNASHPLTSLKCNTPRNKYSLTFKKSSLLLIDHLVDKKINFPVSHKSESHTKKIKGYSFQKKITTDLYTYTLYLKKISLKNLDWSGHLTVSTFLSYNAVSFFFPLKCLNKNHLKSRIFISLAK